MFTRNRRVISIVRGTTMVLALGCASIAASVAAPSLATCSAASSSIIVASIYFYNAEGEPVNVTASYVYQNPYVLNLSNNIVGDVDGNGVITDPVTDAVIGYITE